MNLEANGFRREKPEVVGGTGGKDGNILYYRP